MAAKQGLTAQIHQYSEDTKRSLLSRAPAGIKSHSWLSNLNTTCTIKSAPPRTPEVMSMLGTKCGWLAKRNEQHVWQKRWCCVVPHTFLYYFEASPMEVKTADDGEDHNNTMHTHEAWSGGGINVNIFTNLDQDALNAAVKDGYEADGVAGSGGTTSRMSLYALPTIMGGGGGGAQGGGSPPGGEHHHGMTPEEMLAWDPETSHVNNLMSPGAGDGDNAKGTYQFVSSSNLQPVGIIDLECYSAVNRSKLNPTVLELAGDSVTNPDLRSFYFQSPCVEDAESWTKALLSDRHQSLKDETDAYRQVCDSFPLQLANCSRMIDEAEQKAEEMEREAYSVRSASEEGRRKVVSAVREMLERKCWETEQSKRKGGSAKKKKKGNYFADDDRDRRSTISGPFGIEESKSSKEENKALLKSVLDSHYDKLETNRVALLRELEAALASPSAVATSNVVPPVQTLVDYTSAIVNTVGDLRGQLQKVEMDLSTSVKQDQSQLEAMKSAIEGRDAQLAELEKKHQMILSDLKAELGGSQGQVEELNKQLETQRMEFGMYQNATKTKLGELQQHKKILKREVIELRKKIDECSSENTTVAHEYEKVRNSYRAMKDKNQTLERYLCRLEKQVGVQQNMMELMSQGGGASFVGKVVGPGVTQTESKDNISLSGMSMGSKYSRLNSTMSMGGGPTSQRDNSGGAEAKSTCHTSLKPRPLLPPGSGGGIHPQVNTQDSVRNNNNNNNVSPLNTPRFPPMTDGGGNRGLFQGVAKGLSAPENAGGDDHAVEGEDDRDPSTAYYRSDTTTEAEDISPGSQSEDLGNVAVPSPKRSPGIKPDVDKDDGGSNDPIMCTHPGENDTAMSPRTPDDRSHGSLRAQRSEATGTPVQSNSFIEEPTTFVDKVSHDIFENSGLKNIPSLDTNGESILNVNASNEDDEKMKVVSLNESLLEGTKDMSSNDSIDKDDDIDDMDDSASRVSDITEDRTQRQIDDDLAERRKILLAYVNKNAGGESSTMSLSNASTQQKLQTIENMLPVTQGLDGSQRDSTGGGSTGTGKLSVAQRARLDAENRSNMHRSPSPSAREGMKAGDPIRGGSLSSRGNSPMQRSISPFFPPTRGDSNSLSNTLFPPTRGDSSIASIKGGSVKSSNSVNGDGDTLPSHKGSASVSRSGSFWGKIGKAVEKAVDSSVLGVSLPADEDYDSESDVGTSVVSEASTTLAERIAMQRARQVAFLKNKGLIQEDQGRDAPVRQGSPNSRSPTPRRSMSSNRSLSSRWSASRRGLNASQDEE